MYDYMNDMTINELRTLIEDLKILLLEGGSLVQIDTWIDEKLAACKCLGDKLDAMGIKRGTPGNW